MRRAGQASGRAFTEAMRQCWTREKDLAAFLDYRFKIQGCDTAAYVPVVAGGQVRLAAAFRWKDCSDRRRTHSASTTSETTTSLGRRVPFAHHPQILTKLPLTESKTSSSPTPVVYVSFFHHSSLPPGLNTRSHSTGIRRLHHRHNAYLAHIRRLHPRAKRPLHGHPARPTHLHLSLSRQRLRFPR